MTLRVSFVSDPGLTLQVSITNPCTASWGMVVPGGPCCGLDASSLALGTEDKQRSPREGRSQRGQ